MTNTSNIPFVVDGYNIDPNNVKELPPQILSRIVEEEAYYELSNSSVTLKQPIELKEEKATPDNPLWLQEIKLFEAARITDCGRNPFDINKLNNLLDEDYLRKKAKELYEDPYYTTDDTSKHFDLQEGKLYGFEEYTSLMRRYEENNCVIVEDIRLRDNYFHSLNVKGIPLLIFKAKKVEPYVGYRGYKSKLITLHQVNEIEFNDLFW